MGNHEFRDGIILVMWDEWVVIPFFLQETHPLVAWIIITSFICCVYVSNLNILFEFHVEYNHAFPLLYEHQREVVFVEFREWDHALDMRALVLIGKESSSLCIHINQLDRACKHWAQVFIVWQRNHCVDSLDLEEIEVRLFSNGIVPIKCECEQLYSLG